MGKIWFLKILVSSLGTRRPPTIFWNALEDVKSNFKHSPFSSLLALIAVKCHLQPIFAKISYSSWQISFFGQKWHFKAITAKSEDNRLCLKFNYTSSRVSKKYMGGLLVPYLETRIFKNQIFSMFWGFDNTSQYQYAKWVQNTLTICFCLFLNLDNCSGQVCIYIATTDAGS